MHSKLRTVLTIASVLVCSPAGADPTTLIQNGGFETGDFTGWTVFTTSSNGSLGFSPVPDVVSFDVTGRGTSNAARFQVGQVTFNKWVPEGGGLMQDVQTSTGNFLFTVSIAVFWQGFSDCPQCVVHEAGDFSVLLDGVTKTAVSFGNINPGQTLRGTMSFNSDLLDGNHEMKILITRPAKNHGNPAPPGVCTFWACTLGTPPSSSSPGYHCNASPPNSQLGE